MAKKFEELKLSPEVARVIKEFGHTEMFPIQEQALPKLLSGIDIIGQAQTGTGKTAAFAIPIVEKVIPNLREVQAIVLVPTRELAIQVSKEVVKYSKYKPMGVLAVYGGVSINDQIDRLQNTQVVVGTPGRVIDHLKRGTLNLGGVKIVVLDEADRMLDMGFVDDIKYILENVPRQRQTMLFSATMPESILYLAKEHMFRHELIAVSKDEMTVKDIEQVYVEVRFHERLGLLKKIIEEEKIQSAIIFCNTKASVESLYRIMYKMKYLVEAIHGNLSQSRRTKAMEGFRSGKYMFMIATDVAARGLDIKGVSHVINYNVPHDPKDYVHRIGRTGRAGHIGKAITFVTDRDLEFLKGIEWYIDMNIKKVHYEISPEDKKLAEYSSRRGNFREQRYGGQRRSYGNQRQQNNSSDNKRSNPSKYALGDY